MAYKTKQPGANVTVKVKKALYTPDERNLKGTRVRLFVLRTDGFSSELWFPIQHIKRFKDGSMLCPKWLVEKKNKELRFKRLEPWVKIELEK